MYLSSRFPVQMSLHQFDDAFNRLRQFGGQGRAGRAYVSARYEHASRQIIATYDDRTVRLTTDLSRQVSAEVTQGPMGHAGDPSIHHTVREISTSLTPLH